MSDPNTDLDALLESAAQKGARKALAELGLHDETARQDIHDLRQLLVAWRTAKHEAFRTTIRWITLGILALVLAGLISKFPPFHH